MIQQPYQFDTPVQCLPTLSVSQHGLCIQRLLLCRKNTETTRKALKKYTKKVRTPPVKHQQYQHQMKQRFSPVTQQQSVPRTIPFRARNGCGVYGGIAKQRSNEEALVRSLRDEVEKLKTDKESLENKLSEKQKRFENKLLGKPATTDSAVYNHMILPRKRTVSEETGIIYIDTADTEEDSRTGTEDSVDSGTVYSDYFEEWQHSEPEPEVVSDESSERDVYALEDMTPLAFLSAPIAKPLEDMTPLAFLSPPIAKPARTFHDPQLREVSETLSEFMVQFFPDYM